MPYRYLFILFFLTATRTAQAQCNLKEYTRIFNDANTLQEKGAFIEAKNSYEAAKIYACNQKEKDATDGRVDKLFEQINRLRQQADSTALAAYANDLAYKSAISLDLGDRTTAFRLAELAHRYVDANNPNVTRALVGALYYNENPAHTPHAWAEQTLGGHTDLVISVAFSPDGKKLAMASWQGAVKIWDLDSHKNIHTLIGHTDRVNSIAFSPDGKRLATESGDNTAKIWDIESGKDILTLGGAHKWHTSGVVSVTFSSDGEKLITRYGRSTVKVWELEPEVILSKMHGERRLASLILPQLQQYNLETLLDQHPDNEQKLIATQETSQIKAFADLAAAQAAGSNILARVAPHYARADRLYAAALALQDERLIRMDYANMLRRWAEVYKSDGLERKAAELEAKADGLWKETKN